MKNFVCSRASRRSLARILSPLCVGIVLCGTAVCANASTQIYMYQGGTPVNVTATYSYDGHLVYDSYSNPVGTVHEGGSIVDSHGTVVGYITN